MSMIGETPKSYYDEYIRKKGITPRVLSDPPSLLTDRGAYVNFLQTQFKQREKRWPLHERERKREISPSAPCLPHARPTEECREAREDY